MPYCYMSISPPGSIELCFLTHHSLLTPFPVCRHHVATSLFILYPLCRALPVKTTLNILALPTHQQPYLLYIPFPSFLTVPWTSVNFPTLKLPWAPLLDILTSLGGFLCWLLL